MDRLMDIQLVNDRVQAYAESGSHDSLPYVKGLTQEEIELFHSIVASRKARGSWRPGYRPWVRHA